MTKHFFPFKLAVILILVLFLVGCSSNSTATGAASQPISLETPNSQIPTSTAEITVGVVVVDVLNVREGPGTSYPILDSLNKGAKFQILGEIINSTNNKWLLISRADNSFGWVTGDQSYVTIQKEIVDSDTYLAWQKNVEAAKSTLTTPTPSP